MRFRWNAFEAALTLRVVDAVHVNRSTRVRPEGDRLSEPVPVWQPLPKWAREEPACRLLVLFGAEVAERTWSGV